MLPQAQPDQELVVRGRPLPFSFFPVRAGQGGTVVADSLFAKSPWGLMEAVITNGAQAASAPEEARAFLRQARSFYAAANDQPSSNPLLYYYAFLNLGKALLLVRGVPSPLAQARHGISEQYSGAGADPRNSRIVVVNTNGLNVFAELVDRLGYQRPTAGTLYRVTDLFPQVAIGHRLWREATGGAERFVGLDAMQFARNSTAKTLRLRLYFRSADLTRYGITHTRLLTASGLNQRFRQVVSPVDPDGTVCLEQLAPVPYLGRRPTDVVAQLVEPMRERLWPIVTSGPPYRKYYSYLAPARTQATPQIATLWLLFYYLGSIVRYRPHLFEALAQGPYGALVADFIAAQPEQLLYLLASEMCRREVAKPAIV
jgi:hypothetical protein